MLARITGSRVRADVLAAIFGSRRRSWALSDVGRTVRRPRQSVDRELRRLATSGLLRMTLAGGRRTYHADDADPIAREITRLVKQTRGAIPRIRHALVSLRSPTLAWAVVGTAFGPSRPAGTMASSGSEPTLVLVVLSGAPRSLVRVQLADLLPRKTELHCMSIHEWVARLDKGDVLLRRARRVRKLWILGGWDVLVARERAELEMKHLLRTVRTNWREELSDEWDEDWDPFVPVPGPGR